ncbi:MAG: biotin/lipoyl-binding protein, partial [Saprospiraceae bacterium]
MSTEQSNPIRKFLPRIILLLALLGGGWYGYGYWKNSQLYESTDNAQVEGKTAPVLARVAGYVQMLNVEDYAQLRANQLIAVIDSQEYAIAVAQAEADYRQSLADLENARANLRNVTENIKVANANASVQSSRRDKAKTDLQRDQNLFSGNALTQRQLEESRSGVDIQEKQLSATQAQVGQAQVSQGVALANIKKQEAIVQVKKTVLEQQQLRLTYTRIYAPISGKTGKVNVSKG